MYFSQLSKFLVHSGLTNRVVSGKSQFFWRWDAVSTEAAALFSKSIDDQFLCFRPLIFIFSFNRFYSSRLKGSAVMFAEHTPATFPRPGCSPAERGVQSNQTRRLLRRRQGQNVLFHPIRLPLLESPSKSTTSTDHANRRVAYTRALTRIRTPGATTMRESTPDSTIAAFSVNNPPGFSTASGSG